MSKQVYANRFHTARNQYLCQTRFFKRTVAYAFYACGQIYTFDVSRALERHLRELICRIFLGIFQTCHYRSFRNVQFLEFLQILDLHEVLAAQVTEYSQFGTTCLNLSRQHLRQRTAFSVVYPCKSVGINYRAMFQFHILEQCPNRISLVGFLEEIGNNECGILIDRSIKRILRHNRRHRIKRSDLCDRHSGISLRADRFHYFAETYFSDLCSGKSLFTYGLNACRQSECRNGCTILECLVADILNAQMKNRRRQTAAIFKSGSRHRCNAGRQKEARKIFAVHKRRTTYFGHRGRYSNRCNQSPFERFRAESNETLRQHYFSQRRISAESLFRSCVFTSRTVIGNLRSAQIQRFESCTIPYIFYIRIVYLSCNLKFLHSSRIRLRQKIFQRTGFFHFYSHCFILMARIIIGDVLYVDKLPPTCTVKISIHSTLGDAEDGRLVCLGIESVKRKLGRGHSIAGYVVQRSSTPHKGSKLLDIGAKDHFRYGGLLECAVLYLLQCLGKLHFCKG